MALSFDRKYLVALVFGLVCFGALVVLGTQTIGRLNQSLALAEHTRKAQTRIKDVYTALLDLKTSQRGYLVTLRPSYLEAYRKTLAKLDTELAALAEVTADHPEQWGDGTRLLELVEQQRAELARTLTLAQTQGSSAALAAIRAGDGTVVMHEISTLIARMEQEEARALAQHEASTSIHVDRNMLLAATLAALLALLLAAIYALMRRERALRQRADQAEAEAMTALERGVEERTAELRRATQALNLSEARLRAIFDSASEAIITADEDQTIVLANPAAVKMLRCPNGSPVGAPLEKFIPERYREAHRHQVQAFGATEISARHMGRRPNLVALRCDGEEFPIDATISTLTSGGQRLYTVILRDITERRRAETALHDSEARLRRLLMLMPEAVFVASGNRVSFVNEAARRLFGADESALLGRPALELFHPDSIELAKSRVDALLSGTAVVPLIEEKIVRADGTTRIVEATATRIEDGAEVSILSVMRDVTDLKQVQAELDRSHADLQRLAAAQGGIQENERRRIARELHDDLQQKLAAIRMDLVAITERLHTDSAGAAPLLAAVDALAAAAIVSTRRIVNDLRPEILDDLGLVPALEALAQQFSQRTGIACHFEASDEAGDAMQQAPAVRTCLYRVAQESLNNVAKHARATAVQMRLTSAAPSRVVLHISDNGTGLKANDRRKPHSFGLLGMQARVRELGGALHVDSRPGGGTTVEADVPVEVGALAPAH